MQLLPLLKEKKKRLAARRSLTEFARCVGFDPAPHHQLLINELETVQRGECDLLIVEMPPGSAKSTYVNYLFPAWVMAKEPGCKVMTASHNTPLAEQWGRRTRDLVRDFSPLLGAYLKPGSEAAGRWGTEEGSEYYAVGVDVGIMGYRADLAICDDPFGTPADAMSETMQRRVWEWWISGFASRMRPGCRRVLMHQRWHESDLAGRLIRQCDNLGIPYRRLTIRAEAEADDVLGRAPGEMLWDDPSGYNYGAFLRKMKLENDPRSWSALYQQNPTPDSGDLFERQWFKPVAQQFMPAKDQLHVYGASDYAVTSGGGDYTVHVVVGIDANGQLWWLDTWREQASSDVWVDAWCDLVRRWKPLMWAEESGQINAGVGPFLQERAVQRRAFTHRKQFASRHDKAIRAQSIRGRLAMAGISYPVQAQWTEPAIAEMLRFPAGVHDDVVDAMGLIGQLLAVVQAPMPSEPKEDIPYDPYTRGMEDDDEEDDGDY